MLIGESGKS